MIRIIFLLLLYSPIGAFYCSSALSARHGSFPCCFTIWSQPVQPSAALFLSSIEEENGTIRPVKKPIVRRKPVKRVGRQFWTPEEDELLKVGMAEFSDYRDKWRRIIDTYLPHKRSAQLKTRWNYTLNPEIKFGTWTAEEDAKLAELINIHGPSWPLIASLMDGRTYHQCYHRWNYHLNPDNKMLWKKEEDEIIRFFVKQSQREGNREPVWSALLPLLPGRSLEEVTKRYETVEARLKPIIRKDFFSPEDDKVLMEAVKRHGTRSWALIKKYLPRFSQAQCRVRYDYIARTKAVSRTVWSPQEDQELAEAVQKIGGGKWAAIADSLSFPRTGRECKTRWDRELNRFINTSPWTKEEDELIVSMRQRSMVPRQIFHHLKGRTTQAINQRCNELGLGTIVFWKKDEEELLVKTVLECKALKKRFTWSEVARRLSIGKSAEACNGHWRYYQRRLKELQMRNENITNT